MKPALRAGPAEVGAPRRLVGRGGKARVAPPAPAAADCQQALAGHGQVAQRLARVAVGDDGPQRDLQDEVGAAGAVTVRALAVSAALGVVVPPIVKIEEGRQLGSGLEPDTAAVTAVAAVGAAVRHELLAAEADAAGASVAPLDEDIDLVDEHAVAHRGPRAGPAESDRVGADAHEARVAAPLELHVAVDLGEQRVVRADPDVEAGLESRAALAHQDGAAGHELAGEPLDAEHLGIRIAAVSRAADALLVSHRV